MEYRFPLKNTIVHLAVVALLGLLVYSNTFTVPFQFDDVPNISANPIVKKLYYFAHPSAAKEFTGFAHYHALKSRYIGHLSFALNWLAQGSGVSGFHAVNTAIHIINALLVYALVILTFRTPFLERSRLKPYVHYIALFSSALFISHPVQTQAVTYIVQRLASLAALFYLTSLVCYIYSRLSENKRNKITFYILALLTAVLGMKTKENVFTLPLAIAMYEVFFFAGEKKKRLALWIPFALTMLIIPLTIINLGPSVQALMGNIAEVTRKTDTSRIHYLMTEMRVLITYIRLIFLPVRQNLLYDYPVYSSILNPNVFLSILLHIGIWSLGLYFFLKSRKGDPALRLFTLGICWFYLTLAVESTLVPLFMIYEHRVYLPSTVIFISISVGVFFLFDSLDSRKARSVLSAFMVAAVLILGVSTFARNTVWQSERSLWEDDVRKAPGNAKAHASLGDVYAGQGLYDAAKAQYKAALTIDPESEGAMVNLANIHLIQGRVALATELYKKALGINPNQPEVYNNLGLALMKMGQNREAVHYYNIAINLNPRSAETYVNLGKAFLALNDRKGAALYLKEALRLAPGDPEALELLQKARNVQ